MSSEISAGLVARLHVEAGLNDAPVDETEMLSTPYSLSKKVGVVYENDVYKFFFVTESTGGVVCLILKYRVRAPGLLPSSALAGMKHPTRFRSSIMKAVFPYPYCSLAYLGYSRLFSAHALSKNPKRQICRLFSSIWPMQTEGILSYMEARKGF